MGNMWDAADLVQETLVRGFSHLGQKRTVQSGRFDASAQPSRCAVGFPALDASSVMPSDLSFGY
jgi:hypothetical protein